MKFIYLLFFIFAFSLSMWACKGQEKDKFTNLTTGQFEELIQDSGIQLVDVRTVAEYSDGHIPGSLNINVMDENFVIAAEEVLDKAQPVAVYCKSGRRSRNAAKVLVEKGYKVYNLDKGILNWIDEGKETEK